MLAIPVAVSYSYSSLADGRYLTNPTLGDFASILNIPVLKLENETDGGINELTLKQKAQFLRTFTIGITTGPLLYYQYKAGVIYLKLFDDKDVKDAEGYRKWLVRRDTQMSDKILEYLKLRDESKVLIVVGKAHLEGMLKYMTSKIELKQSN